MAATGKIGLEPDFDDIQSQSDAQHPSAETEDIGIVMLSTQPGGKGLVTEGGANVAMPVRGNRHADTGPTHENPTSAVAIFNGRAHLVGKLGIIDRFLGETPHVDDAMPRPFEQLDECPFEGEPAVITSECYVQGMSPGRS